MTLQRWWGPVSTGLVLAMACAAMAWRDCMLLALSLVLAYRLLLLHMDRGAPWRAIAAAVHAFSAGLLAVGAGVVLLAGIAAARLGWWHPDAGHPGPLLLMLMAGAAWCCLFSCGRDAIAEEVRLWLCVLAGALFAHELLARGWTGAPCLFTSLVGVVLLWRGWRLATETASTLLHADSASP